MKHLILLFSMLSMISCSNDDDATDIFLKCDQIIENYKSYDGLEIDCQLHYVLTEYDGQQFIELIAHCADLTRPYVINEDCQDICETAPYDADSECGKYLQSRTEKEILLIAR